MRGRISPPLIFLQFCLIFDRLRCASIASFLVRNWCGHSTYGLPMVAARIQFVSLKRLDGMLDFRDDAMRRKRYVACKNLACTT